MGLDEQICLHVGGAHLVLGDFVGDHFWETFVQDVFVGSDGDARKFFRVGEDGDEVWIVEIGFAEVFFKFENCFMRYVVEGSSLSKISTSNLPRISIKFNTPWLHKFHYIFINQLTQISIDGRGSLFWLHFIKLRILGQSSKEISPSQVVHTCSFWSQRPVTNFSIQMIS